MTLEPPSDTGSIRRTLQRFLAGVLMTVGGILTLSSGLCTLAFVGRNVVESLSAGRLGDFLPYTLIALLIGVPPFILGLGLFLVGQIFWRSAGKTDAD